MSTASGRAKLSRAQLALAYLRLRGLRRDALEHYAIGRATADDGLPVDWALVSLRMVEALLGEDADALPADPERED